jgi:hypothetical protein
MKNSVKAYAVLISLISAMATPALAQQLIVNPVISDYQANTATGSGALANVLPADAGCHNTASGDDALFSDTVGSYNTGTGFSSLYLNTTGNYNTAAGYQSLYSNSTGNYNTATGSESLYSNSTGNDNTASGYRAMYTNTTGINNTAFGFDALYSNTTGKGNAAQGSNALYSNTTGIRNLGIGNNALLYNTSGSYNTAVGMNAGSSQTTGNDTIYINNVGVAGESQTLRLGTQGTAGVVGSGILTAYIAGVAGSQVTGNAVYVTATGQLGVLASSERYKTNVAAMDSSTEKLAQLRPVTFKLKTDRQGTVQYGLIAEEVDKVYPELVVRDQKGAIQGVRYEELAPMLLNEVQKQQRINAAQAGEIRELKGQVAELNDLKQEMRAALIKLQSKDELVAQR